MQSVLLDEERYYICSTELLPAMDAALSGSPPKKTSGLSIVEFGDGFLAVSTKNVRGKGCPAMRYSRANGRYTFHVMIRLEDSKD